MLLQREGCAPALMLSPTLLALYWKHQTLESTKEIQDLLPKTRKRSDVVIYPREVCLVTSIIEDDWVKKVRDSHHAGQHAKDNELVDDKFAVILEKKERLMYNNLTHCDVL